MCSQQRIIQYVCANTFWIRLCNRMLQSIVMYNCFSINVLRLVDLIVYKKKYINFLNYLIKFNKILQFKDFIPHIVIAQQRGR